MFIMKKINWRCLIYRWRYRTNPRDPENSKQGKSGKSGREVNLSANYLRLSEHSAFSLYRFDFEPDIDIIGIRKKFVFDQKADFGGFVYDGANMRYFTRRVPREVMTLTNVLPPKELPQDDTQKHRCCHCNDGTMMRVLNIILKKAMDGLEMKQ